MIAVIRSQLCREEAEQIVASSAPGWSVRFERKLYYPYYWFHFRHSARTLLGTSAVRVSCLVDARTRVGATTDAFDREYIQTDESATVDPAVDEREALRIAERYTRYVIRNQRKALVIPRIEVLEHDLVYKPYWILDCRHDVESRFRVLVDGVNGSFQPLAVAQADRSALVAASTRGEH